MRTDSSAPVEWLQFAALIHAKGVSGIAAIEAEDLSGLGRGCSASQQGKEKENDWDR